MLAQGASLTLTQVTLRGPSIDRQPYLRCDAPGPPPVDPRRGPARKGAQGSRGASSRGGVLISRKDKGALILYADPFPEVHRLANRQARARPPLI